MKIGNHSGRFETSPVDEMKEFILSLAKELNLDTGHCLLDRVLMVRTTKLNPKQKEALSEAIESLVSEDIFEAKEGQLFLTGKGRDLLY